MRIWIDLSNSPHPLLFGPVARRLEESGHRVLITARDNAQTVELARERWSHIAVIGGISPKGRRAKAGAIWRRVTDLRRWARSNEPDVALSHNSYAQVVAARTLRIPAVTAMDFEHQPANHIAFRLANRILLPEALRPLGMHRQGATERKTRFYPGLKEEVYLADFEPDPNVLDGLDIDQGPDARLVVARPAPDRAAYHSFENPLFVDCVKAALRDPSVSVVVLPRHDDQRRAITELGLPRCVVADHALDSRSLMSRADLMIGAGGTMTREAALFGVPTVSLFAGQRPAVDRWLEANGCMKIVERVEDLPAVEPQPREDRLAELRQRGELLTGHFCDAVYAGTRA
jgi:predicted glycosyltransferase